LIPKGPAITLPLQVVGIRGVVEKGGTLDECNGMLQIGTNSYKQGNFTWMNFARKLTNT
jgi:hypothetical protein